MNEDELKISAKKLLLKLNVITGWILPTIFQMVEELENQLQMKIIENYSELNINEVEYAFRSDNSIKDWGHNMNLHLIDEVMIPYINKRFELSKIEEKIKQPAPVQKIYTDEEILNERRCEIEYSYQAMKQGYYPLIHLYFKEVLEMDGLLEEGETIADFFVKKLGANAENIYTKIKN